VISSLPLQTSDAAQRVELEYGWEFLPDPSARMQREEAEQADGWRSARVGLSWNVQFQDLRDYMGAAWYRTSFELPAFRDTRHVLLKFGAVDYFCEVFLNGIPVGTHEGGYTPFSFEITRAVRPGANELLIRVIDPPMDEAQNRAQFPEMMYNEIPHGKQNWYVQNSGIWQGVRIETCPSIYIERLDVVSRVSGDFEIIARLAGIGLTADNGALALATQIATEILDSTGRSVFRSTQALDAASHTMRIKGTISSPKLWEPGNPALYALSASLSGPVQYHRRTRFGFRSFEAREGKLYLNGKPFYMIAALDQDFYPETVHTPTSEEFVRDMMAKAKRLGINLLRCHLKVAHPVYLDVADEMGMLIWAELPSWSDSWFPADHFSTMAAVRADKMFWEILIRDWNHPCIVLQTIMNESWGIDLKDAAQRDWLRTTFDRIKALLEPLGRLVVDNSACEGNFHIKTDIEDFHQYYSMPDHVEKWDKWLAELASRPKWTFSPYGDAQRTGTEPLLVSEFGNWGLPKLPEEIPWWFEIAFGERGVTRPAGVVERFRDFGFDKLFEDFNEMAEETQWHQFVSLKYEIESIRACPALQGYVITGVTDVHWEVNGLLDMWRNEKVYANELSSLQQPDLIFCKLPTDSFLSGQSVELKINLSHFSRADLRGASVRWSTNSGATGDFAVGQDIARGTVAELGTIRLALPAVKGPTTEQLEIQLRARHGHRISENSYDLFVLPAPNPFAAIPLAISPEQAPALAARLRNAGYTTSAAAGQRLLVSTRHDEVVAAHLERGGQVLLLVTAVDALPADGQIAIMPRSGTELDGRWFSNFNWIRTRRPPFAEVDFGPILGFESAKVAPEYVLQGIRPEQYKDVLSGITYGWLNNNCALAVQARAGAGKLLVTTFRFEEYGSDPYATHLLDSFIRYLAGPDCQPVLELAITAHSRT
jgi:hypothetical protein